MNEVVYVPIDRPVSHNDIVEGVFGISLEQLINDIRENRDGKYDSLFEPEKVAL